MVTKLGQFLKTYYSIEDMEYVDILRADNAHDIYKSLIGKIGFIGVFTNKELFDIARRTEEFFNESTSGWGSYPSFVKALHVGIVYDGVRYVCTSYNRAEGILKISCQTKSSVFGELKDWSTFREFTIDDNAGNYTELE